MGAEVSGKSAETKSLRFYKRSPGQRAGVAAGEEFADLQRGAAAFGLGGMRHGGRDCSAEPPTGLGSLAGAYGLCPVPEPRAGWARALFEGRLCWPAACRCVPCRKTGIGKFKQATGINFSEYVLVARVEKARNSLENAHLRVSEITLKVGFQPLFRFHRTFKRVTGQVPGSYRRSLAR